MTREPGAAPATRERPGVACAIIAGGRARRLGGRTKALVQVHGATILERQLAVLGARFSAIAISANDPAPYLETGLPILADRVPDQGPLGGLEAALAWCPEPYLLAVACDMPFLSGAVLDLIVARCRPGVDIVVPYVDGRAQPLCAAYSRGVLPALEARARAGERRAAGLVEDAGLVVERVAEDDLRALDPELRTFVNLNSADDLARIARPGGTPGG